MSFSLRKISIPIDAALALVTFERRADVLKQAFHPVATHILVRHSRPIGYDTFDDFFGQAGRG
jgi:hypothetical protein